ncbi:MULTISPECIES: hypothetical protein [Tsukamurella]|uniref:Uncharacterized protein n=1 Tax=Tsukamurella strandjordii TaxID=147577 RepID=A0AA90NJ19_9ACTN|nr:MULTISPECIES: hypothetical protein [Tsukamurella]MDP0398909.1 hypothetical protein [Tsukamurella strandjordii]GIZ95794.1 hypothetical protein TTY48_04060 [Tsukamurella sp. TY48]
MLDHYDVRSGEFHLGIRPPAARRASLGIWRAVKAVLNAAADLDATVYGARLHARMSCELRP